MTSKFGPEPSKKKKRLLWRLTVLKRDKKKSLRSRKPLKIVTPRKFKPRPNSNLLKVLMAHLWPV